MAGRFPPPGAFRKGVFRIVVYSALSDLFALLSAAHMLLYCGFIMSLCSTTGCRRKIPYSHETVEDPIGQTCAHVQAIITEHRLGAYPDKFPPLRFKNGVNFEFGFPNCALLYQVSRPPDSLSIRAIIRDRMLERIELDAASHSPLLEEVRRELRKTFPGIGVVPRIKK
jgi:hypothetical protein